MKKYYFLLLCLCGCAVAAQPDSALPPVIDNSSYPSSAPSVNANSSSTAVYELMGRLDKLQAEVQQLTGKVEEQGNLIAELKKRQTSAYSDLDERLQSFEKTGSPRPSSEPVAETPAAPADNTAILEPPKPAPSDMAVGIPSQSIAVTKPVAKQPEVQASGGEKQAYQLAYTSLRSGKTDQSIEQFKAYLSQYPTGGYADVAYYWLGEAYRVKPDANAAREAYNTVMEKYPNSPKVSEALLKLGYVELDQKNTDKAREYLNRVISEYANTAAAHLAEKKLASIK
jgi:tol-pal system protein YbgF